MLRWPDYFADPPSDTTSGDVNSMTHGHGVIEDQIDCRSGTSNEDVLVTDSAL